MLGPETRPSGWNNGSRRLTQEIAISAPPGTAANPLTLVFRLDASRVPAGETESSLAILRNGVAVPACGATCSGPASPDPCVCARALLGDGDVEITVRTSAASIWNFAVDRCALPETNCRAPVGPGKASLLLRDDADDTKDLVLWKWLNGTATPKEAFGNPLAADDYVFCLYAGGETPSVRMRLEAPAGGTCDGAPCWTELRSGFKFKDRSLAPDGQLQILMKGSETPGSPKIKVKGKGTGLRMSALPIPQGASVTAQLKSAGACWDATYGISPIVSDAAQFKDKSD